MRGNNTVEFEKEKLEKMENSKQLIVSLVEKEIMLDTIEDLTSRIEALERGVS